MRRPYTTEGFAALLIAIRSLVPGCAITTDVIVGFPGETDEEFERSLAFVAGARFARVHAFTYSERPGTDAAALPDRVAPERKRERIERLLATAAAGEETFRRQHLGTVARVLWEGKRNGAWIGTTDNYLRVFARDAGDAPAGSAGAGLRGRITDAVLTGLVAGGVAARFGGR
jgi:threonylcarbamoyladenosine tRNA methylthiotransferase MtaB